MIVVRVIGLGWDHLTRWSINNEIVLNPFSVLVIHFSTYFYHFVRSTKICHFHKHTHTHTHTHIYIYIYIYHQHIALVARISLTLSRHSSLSFIALGRSLGQHPVSSHSCWMYVRAGRPVFARPCVGIHKSTSLMSSSLLLQQCPACLVRLTWIVFVIGGRWPYSWCLVGCCCQDLFRIARSMIEILDLEEGYFTLFILKTFFKLKLFYKLFYL